MSPFYFSITTMLFLLKNPKSLTMMDECLCLHWCTGTSTQVKCTELSLVWKATGSSKFLCQVCRPTCLVYTVSRGTWLVMSITPLNPSASETLMNFHQSAHFSSARSLGITPQGNIFLVKETVWEKFKDRTGTPLIVWKQTWHSLASVLFHGVKTLVLPRLLRLWRSVPRSRTVGWLK